MILYNICVSLSDLLHLVWYSLLHPYCCLWHYFNPFYGEVIFHCASTHTHTRTRIFLTQLSVDGHMGCFCILAVVNSAVMNIGLRVSFQIEFLCFLDICPRVGLLGNVVALFFSILRNLLTLLHSRCTNLHSHQQCRRVLFSSHPLKHLLIVLVLMIAILPMVKW